LNLEEVRMSRWGPVLRCGLGGLTLGLATLATFSFVGVPTIPTQPAKPTNPFGPGRPGTLRAALLSSADLPPGFVPTLAAPAFGPPAGAGCAALLAHPAADWPGAVQRDQSQAATGARLWEAVTAPAGDTVARLRDRLVACTRSKDARVRELPPPVPGGYAFALSVGRFDGYLAAGQVGPAASVLRFLAPAGPATDEATRPEAVAVTLRTALAKLVGVTGPTQG
jgi:hypothetical protein